MARQGGTAPDAASEVDRQLAEIDALRRRVLNVVGHALRTPVATVRGLVDVVAEAPERAGDPALVESLVRSARRLEELLDDALVSAGVSTRLPTQTPRAVRVLDLVREVWSELGGDDDDLVLDGDPTLQVMVGPDTVRWLLRHVLDNALRYGERPVTVAARTEELRLALEVDSPGPPLPEADLTHAVELFYRGEAAVVRRTSALGVGLTVARTLAEHAGGTVELRHRVGGGVVTRIELPVATTVEGGGT